VLSWRGACPTKNVCKIAATRSNTRAQENTHTQTYRTESDHKVPAACSTTRMLVDLRIPIRGGSPPRRTILILFSSDVEMFRIESTANSWIFSFACRSSVMSDGKAPSCMTAHVSISLPQRQQRGGVNDTKVPSCAYVYLRPCRMPTKHDSRASTNGGGFPVLVLSLLSHRCDDDDYERQQLANCIQRASA
jgi:hypothetical protein